MPQPNPSRDPNPLGTDQFTHHHYPTPYSSSYYSQNPNPSVSHEPNYSSAALDPTLKPPGTEPYVSHSSFSHCHVGVYEAHQASAVAYAHYQTVDVGAAAQPSAYPDSISVKELVQQYGGAAPQNGAEQLVPATSKPTMWTNPAIHPCGPWKKGPKKVKVVQSQFCEVCKITCNTKEVLDKHKTGKKHMKNLEKRQAATAAAATPKPAAVPNNPVIGPQVKPGMGNSVSGQKRNKAETVEDLEIKKKKIMEGGAAANAVRSCAICNVVCNSETVFKFHLAGQKHASMLKKLTGGTGLATAT